MCCDWNAFLTREQLANQTVFDDQRSNQTRKESPDELILIKITYGLVFDTYT